MAPNASDATLVLDGPVASRDGSWPTRDTLGLVCRAGRSSLRDAGPRSSAIVSLLTIWPVLEDRELWSKGFGVRGRSAASARGTSGAHVVAIMNANFFGLKRAFHGFEPWAPGHYLGGFSPDAMHPSVAGLHLLGPTRSPDAECQK